MNCPSCGAEIPIDAQYARLVVCGHCKTSIIVDEKAARVAGKMAVLAQTPGPLFVGGAGKIRGKRFEVVGRVRYGYAKGFWDEWYLRFEDGKAAWISEDEYNFTLEVLRTDIQTPVDFAQAKPGDVAKVGDTTYHIDEKDVANCEGGEGQLPFSIAADQKVPFLEMSAGRRFCTLEYELDGGVRVFVGKRIKVGSIRMDVSAQEAGAVSGLAAERAATDGGRERIVRSGERSQEIKCFACAAPLGVPEVGADSMTCQYCSAELDLTLRRVDCAGCGATVPLHGGAAAKGAVCPHCRAILNVVTDQVSLLGSLLNARQPRVPFTLGQKCVFDEATYILVGHIHYVEQWEVPYHSDEFLLYNKKLGYRWLVMSDGHFSWSVELDERPLNFDPRTAVPKRTFTFNDRSWTVFEVARNKARVTWVNGELPWVAQVGDKNSFMDAIDPPYLLSAEWTEDEMEWYQAEYLPRASVAEAFGMEVDRLPRAIDIAPHQPYPASPFRKQGSLVMIVFALIMGTLAVLALMGDSTKVADFTVTPEQYAQEYLTQSFSISEADTLCEAKFSAGVDNSWVYLDLAVVDASYQAVLDFSAQMSYYHGVEGGESWSEGSKRDTKVFKLKTPGDYRLLMVGQAGVDNKGSDVLRSGAKVHITISEGVELTRYYAGFGILCLLAGAVEPIRRYSFEYKRWGGEDDDD